MRRALVAAVFVVALGCEEINYVTIAAPPELVGATVAIPGTELRARLTRVREDGTVETDHALPLPPVEQWVLIEKIGCDPIEIAIPVKLGRTRLVVQPQQVNCLATDGSRRPN